MDASMSFALMRSRASSSRRKLSGRFVTAPFNRRLPSIRNHSFSRTFARISRAKPRSVTGMPACSRKVGSNPLLTRAAS